MGADLRGRAYARAVLATEPTPGQPRVRFDDLVAGTRLSFEPLEVRLAHRLDEVLPLLNWVDQITGAGHWAAGFVGYEASAAFDPAQLTRSPVPGEPLAWFARCAPPQTPPSLDDQPDESSSAAAEWRLDADPAQFAAGVQSVREQIGAGASYQVNLTTRARAQLAERPEQLYRRLALGQRGAFNAFVELGDTVVPGDPVIVSASPECFFEWRGDTLRTVPMKGTAARGWDAASDVRAAQALTSSAKDRAENLMIVDLMRNDLSRICTTGSVRVERLFDLERYPTVWQLTSTIAGQLRPGTGLAEVFGALFPCGSITGAPKASSMRIIAELENSPRGVYCGAIGWVAPAGHELRARFGVAIRTAQVDRASGSAVYGVGAGITWGSDPQAEYREVVTKSAVLDSAPGEFGLIETLGVRAGEPVHWPAHLARLQAGADYFGFALDAAAIDRRVRAAASAAGTARLRLELHRDGSIDLQLGELPAPDAAPVRLALDRPTIDPHSPWVHHKTTRRAHLDAARGRHRGADDVLLVNTAGRVTESTIANLAALIEGRWLTPFVASGCLPGIERGRALAQGRLVEAELSVEAVRGATELALLSSLRGWRPAILL